MNELSRRLNVLLLDYTRGWWWCCLRRWCTCRRAVLMHVLKCAWFAAIWYIHIFFALAERANKQCVCNFMHTVWIIICRRCTQTVLRAEQHSFGSMLSFRVTFHVNPPTFIGSSLYTRSGDVLPQQHCIHIVKRGIKAADLSVESMYNGNFTEYSNCTGGADAANTWPGQPGQLMQQFCCVSSPFEMLVTLVILCWTLCAGQARTYSCHSGNQFKNWM